MMNRPINAIVLLVIAGATSVTYAGETHQHGTSAIPLCPVMGEPVNLAISEATPEGPVFFCCESCVSKHKANPAKYAEKVTAQRAALAARPRVQTTCPVSGEPVKKSVSLDHQGAKVYFCREDCVGKFKADPGKYAAALANSYTYQTHCPVMGGKVDPASFTELADGRKIYYCCDGCEGKLFGQPAKYGKKLVEQGYQFNWSKIKKADAKAHGHGEGAHGHVGHDHSGH